MLHIAFKLKDLFTRENYTAFGDVDVYDGYDDRCAVAWCGNGLTDEGLAKFADILEHDTTVYVDTATNYVSAVVECDNGREANKLTELMHTMAGYCSEEEYERFCYDL